jgi:hypothetical protein
LREAPAVQALARLGHSLNHGRRAAQITRTSRLLQARRRGIVQRFPANVYTTPHNWSGNDYDIAPLSGGMMAALFKLTQHAPVPPTDIRTVIVKALEVDEPESIQLGEEFLRQMGMATPQDRIIMPGTAEFVALCTSLGFKAGAAPGQFLRKKKAIGGLLLMQDLTAIGATTMQSKLMQATSRADIDDVFTWMTDPAVLDAVGKLAVFDPAIGNFDRMTMDAANFGNLMIRRGGAAATQVFLIDTNARLPRLTETIMSRAETQGAFYEDRVMKSKLLTGIFKNRADAIDSWFEAIPSMIYAQQRLREDEGHPRVAILDTEKAYIDQKVAAARAAAHPIIQASFDAAMNSLRTMMANKADLRRTAIKAAATGTQSFETLKANVAYLEQRTRQAPPGTVGDPGHAAAASIVEAYGRYRVSKQVAGVPANNAVDPFAVAAPVVPKRLQASGLTERVKGDSFKAKQAADFRAFLPVFTAFQTSINDLTAFLKQIKPLLDNLKHLRRSLAAPGDTRNQRAMVSHQKRTAEFGRAQGLLRAPAQTGVLWSDEYAQQAAALVAGMEKASDRYDALKTNHLTSLRADLAKLAAIRDQVNDLVGHLR